MNGNKTSVRSRGIQRFKEASALSLYAKGVEYAKQRKWGNAMEMYHSALSLQRQIFGLDHLNTATTLNELGVVLSQLGNDFAAMTAFEEALWIRQVNLGNGHEDVAETLTNLLLVTNRMKEIPEAQSQHQDEAKDETNLRGKLTNVFHSYITSTKGKNRVA